MSSPETSAEGARGPSDAHPDLDVRGARRLAGKEEWFWYLFAAVTYIVCGIWQKFLLNWIIGPMWLVAVIVIGPAVWDRVRGRRRSGEES